MNKSKSISVSRNGNGTTTQPQSRACAACKYQRRKCGPTCILAPYFPHDRQTQFQNAHKLFGVAKITNTLKNLDPLLWDKAMSSIIYQSDMRALDPVGGCYAYIKQLESQIHSYTAELNLVLQHLANFRAQHHLYSHNPIPTTTTNTNVQQIINADADSMNIAATPQPCYHYLRQVPQFLVQETGNSNSTLLQEDVNVWAMQNIIPQSPLSLQGILNGNASIGIEYDHKPMLDPPMKVMSSNSSPKH